MNPHQDAVQTLQKWQPADLGQEALRHAFLGYLAAREDACLRSCAAGHITASTVVLDASGEQTLLTLHPRVGRWIQLGGHCEADDESLQAAALREATEESGIDGLLISAEPVHLDVHPVNCSLGVPTRHFDIRFVAHAPAGATPVRSAESADLRWWPLAGLPEDSQDLVELIRFATAA